ncbi:hypothetical protein MTR62_18755 [Novosphingobium sp. 1949]|uniref:Uncharacterized protein n=1 Tax=Novosphingobium organovorum TaxID=2930092 RepID=A0ABT0BIN8_9SPHN|nr:hypothetical protein [Novosphingobium organovorum]
MTGALFQPDAPAAPTLDRPTLMALMERDNER